MDTTTNDAVERAVQAACAEAGWDWEPEPGVMSPADAMRPIIVAALSVVMPHPAASQWQSATFYGKPDGGWVPSPEDMEIAIDSVITAHPAVKHEDSQEADDNYGDLLNELVVAAAAAFKAPTTHEVRAWATWVPATTVDMKISVRAEAGFDRWLAERDAQVAAVALRDVAERVNCRDDYELIVECADRIAGGLT